MAHMHPLATPLIIALPKSITLCISFDCFIHNLFFFKIMGHMDVITIISDGFNVYFPTLILAVCLATYFNVGTRILSILGFPQFLEDDDLVTDYIQEGRLLVVRGWLCTVLINIH